MSVADAGLPAKDCGEADPDLLAGLASGSPHNNRGVVAGPLLEPGWHFAGTPRRSVGLSLAFLSFGFKQAVKAILPGKDRMFTSG